MAGVQRGREVWLEQKTGEIGGEGHVGPKATIRSDFELCVPWEDTRGCELGVNDLTLEGSFCSFGGGDKGGSRALPPLPPNPSLFLAQTSVCHFFCLHILGLEPSLTGHLLEGPFLPVSSLSLQQASAVITGHLQTIQLSWFLVYFFPHPSQPVSEAWEHQPSLASSIIVQAAQWSLRVMVEEGTRQSSTT